MIGVRFRSRSKCHCKSFKLCSATSFGSTGEFDFASGCAPHINNVRIASVCLRKAAKIKSGCPSISQSPKCAPAQHKRLSVPY